MLANYTATVKIDGTEIKEWNEFSVTRRLGQGEAEFEVNIARPIDTNPQSKLTISESFGGGSIDLINDKFIEQASSGLQQGSLRGSGSAITNYAPPVNLVFVNQSWLKRKWPFYTLRNGVIHRMNPGNSTFKIHGVSPTRLFVDELPGKNVRDSEFECIVESNLTYRRIASILADRVKVTGLSNYTIQTNVPDIRLQKTLTIGAGQSYFRSIIDLFKYFRPFVDIENNVINIHDVGGSNQGRPPGSGLISLTEDAFSVYQYNQLVNYDVIDHVLVVGPSMNFTYSYYKPVTKKQLTAKTLGGQIIELTSKETHTIENVSDLSLYYELSYPAEGLVKNTERKVKMVVDDNTGDSAVVKEEIHVYSDMGIEHSIYNDYEYADFNTPTQSTTEEYARMPRVDYGYEPQYVSDASSSYVVTYKALVYDYKLVSRTITKYTNQIEDLGIVEYDKYIYRDIVFYKDKIRKDNHDYTLKSGAVASQDAIRMGIPFWEKSSTAGTGWETVFTLNEHEMLRVETVSNSMIRKNVTHTTYFPCRTPIFKSEDIPLKKKKVQDTIEKRWSFINNNGNIMQFNEDTRVPSNMHLHPRLVINCPDCIDAATAENIARHAMASKPSSLTTASIRTTIPILGAKPGQSITIPTCVKEYFDFDYGDFRTVNVRGGTYWINAASRKVRFTGSWNTNIRSFEVISEFELKDKY